jgi:hypothetical protein
VHSVGQVRRQKKGNKKQSFNGYGCEEGELEVSFAAIDSRKHLRTNCVKIDFF